MPGIYTPDSTNSIQCLLVSNVTAQCIAGIGWIGDDATLIQNLNGLMYQALLGIFWMNIERTDVTPLRCTNTGRGLTLFLNGV